MAFATMAVFAPFIAPTNPYDLSSIDIMDAELPPSWMDEGDERFTLGTDDQGRDIFSTILYGSRLSLTIGLLAVGLQLILGVIIGLSAGYFGGRIDNFFNAHRRCSTVIFNYDGGDHYLCYFSNRIRV